MWPFQNRKPPAAPPPVERYTRDLGRVDLDDVAVQVDGFADLCGAGPSRIAYLEVVPEKGQVVAPAFWMGQGRRDVFDHKTSRAPPARLYRFTGRTDVYAKGIVVRDEGLIAFDRFKFQEFGRPDDPYNSPYLALSEAGARVTLATRLREIEGPCLMLSAGGEQVWGHWLVDMLPRLGLALMLPVPFRVIVGDDAPGWAVSLLEKAGVAEASLIRQQVGREVLRVQDLYLPGYLRYANAFSPLANVAWGSFRTQQPESVRRLYVSRRHLAAGSTIVNAADVEGLAERRSYTIVHPQTRNLADQIRLFAGATHVIGESGSGLHNTAFSPAGTQVGVLLSPAIEGFVQAGIGQVRGQPTGFAFGTKLDSDRDFEMPISALAEVLDAMG